MPAPASSSAGKPPDACDVLGGEVYRQGVNGILKVRGARGANEYAHVGVFRPNVSLGYALDGSKAVVYFCEEGLLDRLTALMGFEGALMALAEDPEECSEFFSRLADYKVELIECAALGL